MLVENFIINFLTKVENLLVDDGVAMIHTIGSVDPPRDPHPWITKYIFPGGYTPSLSEAGNFDRKSRINCNRY
jgi:cyclopropane-fatty-acyl-phospholipid synthase